MTSQLPAVHAGHFDIGQDEMYGAVVFFDGGEGLPAVAGFQGLIPGPGQHAPGEVANGLFVVHYQDGKAAGRSLRALGMRGRTADFRTWIWRGVHG
jgi:hypothetical protein